MKIHTTTLTTDGVNHSEATEAVFQYAMTVLGDGWSLEDPIYPHLIFTDPTGSGTYGWRIDVGNESQLISQGIRTDVLTDVDHGYLVGTKDTPFTGLVWESSNGSVGLGYVDSTTGLYITWCMLIKFDGKYQGQDVYGVAYNFEPGHGKIMVHGRADIGTINQSSNNNIGSGVYLHSLYDPISGLISSDVFGVQSMNSTVYAKPGTKIRQGSNTYMAVLGGITPNPENTLFVKM